MSDFESIGLLVAVLVGGGALLLFVSRILNQRLDMLWSRTVEGAAISHDH